MSSSDVWTYAACAEDLLHLDRIEKLLAADDSVLQLEQEVVVAMGSLH
ncbi:MAG TPA: hypothetical protein VJ372_07315 [Pyrinomonadaceae bacterium]|nr:hypothetical protein [Pyrinomonadaceae bacterium]